ncbi:MAG: glutathione S-transferase family protein [Candidatus Binataceae bacterium]
MLEIYDNEFSSCSTKVRLVLAEKDIPWTRHRIDLVRFEQKTPCYLKLNPNGVVPTAIVDEGPPLLESHIIIQYLDSAYPGPAMAPEHAAGRARMLLWLKAIDDIHLPQGIVNYDQLFLPYWRRMDKDELEGLLAGFASPSAADRMRYLIGHGLGDGRVSAAKRELRAFYLRVDGQLANNRYLMGERYTLADVALTPYVNSPLHAVSNLWFGEMPHIARWLGAIRTRPNFDRAVTAYPLPADFEAMIMAAPEGGGVRAV